MNSSDDAAAKNIAADDSTKDAQQIPVAEVRQGGGWQWATRSPMWLATLFCAGLAIYLGFSGIAARPYEITLDFRHGHGIEPGDPVKRQGIEVGTVTAVELSASLDGVRLTVALHDDAHALARAGTRFWIQRPQVRMAQLTGLDTLIGAKYIGVEPAADPGRTQRHFVGLEAPLTLADAGGSEIVIRFRDGHGLRVGDGLLFRGMRVGEVTELRLDEQLAGVHVIVQLTSTAAPLARRGSQFWVRRPEVSLRGISGLDTLVKGSYLEVIPGPEQAEPVFEFDGIDTFPWAQGPQEDGLELVLESDNRNGLDAGSPVTYRGIVVGRVMRAGLSADSTSVVIRVWIDPPYRDLVRDNSVFWATSGFDVHFGLRGFRMNAETLSTIAAGGVAFATPDRPGRRAAIGKRFKLAPAAEDAWNQWAPAIEIGDSSDHQPTRIALVRVAVRWRARRIGISRQQQRTTWGLPIDSTEIWLPAGSVNLPDGARRILFEVDGQSYPLTDVNVRIQDGIARCRLPEPHGIAPAGDRLRAAVEPEPVQLIADPVRPPLPLPDASLRPINGAWQLDQGVDVDPSLHGAAVVSVADGAILGILVRDQQSARVQLISPAMTTP